MRFLLQTMLGLWLLDSASCFAGPFVSPSRALSPCTSSSALKSFCFAPSRLRIPSKSGSSSVRVGSVIACKSQIELYGSPGSNLYLPKWSVISYSGLIWSMGLPGSRSPLINWYLHELKVSTLEATLAHSVSPPGSSLPPVFPSLAPSQLFSRSFQSLANRSFFAPTC